MENWLFLDAPRWTVDVENVDGMEVRPGACFQVRFSSLSSLLNILEDVSHVNHQMAQRAKKSACPPDPLVRGVCAAHGGGRTWAHRPHSLQHRRLRCVRCFLLNSYNDCSIFWADCPFLQGAMFGSTTAPSGTRTTASQSRCCRPARPAKRQNIPSTRNLRIDVSPKKHVNYKPRHLATTHILFLLFTYIYLTIGLLVCPFHLSLGKFNFPNGEMRSFLH